MWRRDDSTVDLAVQIGDLALDAKPARVAARSVRSRLDFPGRNSNDSLGGQSKRGESGE